MLFSHLLIDMHRSEVWKQFCGSKWTLESKIRKGSHMMMKIHDGEVWLHFGRGELWFTPNNAISCWGNSTVPLSEVWDSSFWTMKLLIVSINCSEVLRGLTHFRLMRFFDGVLGLHASDAWYGLFSMTVFRICKQLVLGAKSVALYSGKKPITYDSSAVTLGVF